MQEKSDNMNEISLVQVPESKKIQARIFTDEKAYLKVEDSNMQQVNEIQVRQRVIEHSKIASHNSCDN